MDESYSIHCTSKDWQRVLKKLDEMSGWKYKSISNQQILATSHSGTLKISSLFAEVGGKYGFIYAGLINKVQRINPSVVFERKSLIEQLKNTHMIIGCVASPEFKDLDERFSFIFTLASILNGIVFDGFTLLSSTGEIIISLDGST